MKLVPVLCVKNKKVCLLVCFTSGDGIGPAVVSWVVSDDDGGENLSLGGSLNLSSLSCGVRYFCQHQLFNHPVKQAQVQVLAAEQQLLEAWC